MYYCYQDSPAGKLLLAGNRQGLHLICFPGSRKMPEKKWIKQEAWEENPRSLKEVTKQLNAYFSGKLKKFSLRLCLHVTPFQKKVLTALQQIPYGETLSYGELACKIGKPGAARAVGQANARNPIPIVIPCHRVIGSSGNLTGFGGGLSLKQKLLDMEQQNRRG